MLLVIIGGILMAVVAIAIFKDVFSVGNKITISWLDMKKTHQKYHTLFICPRMRIKININQSLNS